MRHFAVVSSNLNHTWIDRDARRFSPAVWAGLAIIAVSMMTAWDSATARSALWLPRLDSQDWAPLERVVITTLLAAGAWITFRVAVRQFANPTAGLAIVLLTLLLFPANGSATGFFLYAVVLWAVNRYVERPGREGFWLLTLLTVIVSAIRIDHGLVVAAAAVAALFLRHVREGAREFGRELLGFTGSLVVVALLFAPLGEVHASAKRLGERVTDVVARGEIPEIRLEPTFKVRWAPDVDVEARAAKEREHQLLGGQMDLEDTSGRTWRYRWHDQNPGSVMRMLNDPAIEDTQGINRASAEYIGSTPTAKGLEWIGRLSPRVLRIASRATLWLWVILPIAALVRLLPALRRTSVLATSRRDLAVLPALILSLPIARLVTQDAWDFGALAAPALPALAFITTWLFTWAPPTAESTAHAAAWLGDNEPDRRGKRRHLDLYICAGVSFLTLFLHVYLNTTITNDHSAYLAMARQIVYGDWPLRDFRDDGSLLQIVLSAAVQKVGGFHLLGDLALSWVFFAAANCLTYWLAFRLSRSRVAAAVAAVLAALLVPRPYAYPKLFIHPLALLVLWRYLERPRPARLAAVGATTALAFLFRFDHGVVVAATSVVAVAAVHVREPRAALRELAFLVAWCALFALPQLAYVIWAVGLPRYLESVVTFGVFAAENRQPWPFAFSASHGLLTEMNAVVVLLYVYLAVACAALVAAGRHLLGARLRRPIADDTSRVFVVLVMWGLMLPMLARGQYYTRVAEIAQPIAILGAWIAVQWLPGDRPSALRWSAFGALVTAVVVALCLRTPMVSFFSRPAEVFQGAPFQARLLNELARSMPIERFAPADDSDTHRVLVRYAQACTKPTDRLLVTGFAPDVYFYAGRPFAGDRWVYMAFDNSPERQRQVVEKLQSQSVPIVFVDANTYGKFREAWPALAAHLDRAYTVASDVPGDDDRITRVLADRNRVPSDQVEYPFARLPCFN